MEKTKIEATYQEAETRLKGFIGFVLGLKFMEDLPNDNTILEQALSDQITSVNFLIFLILDHREIKEKFENHIACAMFVRSLIEVAANMNYMVSSESNDEIAARYMATADEASDTLRKFLRNEKAKPVYWTTMRLSDRIKLLESYSIINNDYEKPYIHTFRLLHTMTLAI